MSRAVALPHPHYWTAGSGIRSRLFDPASRPVYRLLVLHVAAMAVMMTALRFWFDGDDMAVVITLIMALFATAIIMRLVGQHRAASVIEGVSTILLSSLTTASLSVLLATRAAPYADTWLATADATLFPFMSWPKLALALARYGTLTAAMCRIYSSLSWQPFVLVIALSLSGRSDQMWRFLHAWLLALTATVTVFAFAPAVTAYVHYGFTRAQFPALVVDAGWYPATIIARIRAGTIHSLNISTMTGLVSFPSFHAAGGTLLAWGYRRVPVFGPVLVGLDVLLVMTVPFIGSHYFIDVLAGIAVALVCIHASTRTGRSVLPLAPTRA